MRLHKARRSPARRPDDLDLLQGLLTQRLYLPDHDRQLLRVLLAETPQQLRTPARATRRRARRLRTSGAALALSGALALTLSSPLLTAVAASPHPSAWVAVADHADTLAPAASDALLRALLNRASAPIQSAATAEQARSAASDVLLRALLNSESASNPAVTSADQATLSANHALAQAELAVGQTLAIPSAQVASAIAAALSDTIVQQSASYYVVQPGDTLSAIALAYYGDADLWPAIFNANTDKLSNPNWIYPNQQLMIPATGYRATATANPPAGISATAVPVASQSGRGLGQYTVQSGDTLSGIAYYAYGNANWQSLYQANAGQIADPDLIYPGQVLTVP